MVPTRGRDAEFPPWYLRRNELVEPQKTVERNIALTGRVTKYIMANPQLLASLPARFELVVLPNDDPDLQAYNLALHDQYRSAGIPVVFARLNSSRNESELEPALDLYVPLAL